MWSNSSDLRESLVSIYKELIEIYPGECSLPQLYVDAHLDCEQIWNEIILLTHPVGSHIRKRLRVIDPVKVLLIPEHLQMDSHGEEDDDEDGDSDDDSSSGGNDSNSDDDQRAMDDEDDFFGDAGGEPVDGDAFFNMEDMLKFVDEAEREYYASDEDAQGEEEKDEIETNEIQALVDAAGMDTVGNDVRYQDFYDMDEEADAQRGASEEVDQDRVPRTLIEERDEYAKELANKIELANVEKKHWALSGEVGTRDRPEGSLLETFLDFDYVAPTTPMITEEFTAKLEAIVKRRILEKSFDDVVRKKEVKVSRRPRVELNMQKDSRGLGEVFEDEYLQAIGMSSKSDELTVEEQALQKQFLRLCRKLDALTNEHYAPSAPKVEEITVTAKDVPAIALEEAIPVGVSTAQQLAPEEISAPRRIVKGTDEWTKADRQKKRKQKKRAFAKKTSAKLESMRIRASQDPVFAAKFKAAKEAHNAVKQGNVKEGKQASRKDSKKYSSSAQFFQRLQTEVETEANRIRGDAAPKKKRKKSSQGASFIL